SVPPYGDGKWRLYDIRNDPTETRDLSAEQPNLVQTMLADYAGYVSRNGVVEVPAGYDVISAGEGQRGEQGLSSRPIMAGRRGGSRAARRSDRRSEARPRGSPDAAVRRRRRWSATATPSPRTSRSSSRRSCPRCAGWR